MGHLRFTFTNTSTPYILLQATRPSTLGSPAPPPSPSYLNNISYPEGTITIDQSRREICGSNPERQDWIIAPISTPATNWKGYFCARFDADFEGWGTANNGTLHANATEGKGAVLSGYATFNATNQTVNVRVGVSFISIEQARRNIDSEIPDGKTLEETARETREAWAEKLDRIQIEGASTDDMQTFYTGFFHTLQVHVLFVLRERVGAILLIPNL